MPTDSGTHRELHLPDMTDTPAIKQNANGIYMLEGEQLWDSDILPICLEHINPGDTVIDAGAWIGGHTMAYAKKVGVEGRVIAIEPNPFASDCLRRNTEKFSNVIVEHYALGDTHGQVSFSAKKGWYDSGHVGDDENISNVYMITLDSFMTVPNFIKIDVEGCELKVLKGAAKTIEKHRPKMVIEINRPALERQGSVPIDVFGWLHAHGYTYQPIDNYMNDVYNILAIP